MNQRYIPKRDVSYSSRWEYIISLTLTDDEKRKMTSTPSVTLLHIIRSDSDKTPKTSYQKEVATLLPSVNLIKYSYHKVGFQLIA